MMKRLLLAAALLAASISQAGAVWWLENDYSFGSNGLKKNSLTVFRKTSRAFTSGRERVYSARLPLMYSGPAYFISLKPFLYPVAPSTRSGAYGGKLYGLVSIDEGQDESFTHLVFSGAWARQKAYFGDTAAPERKEFSQYAFELQAEKSFYGQFFFLASAAGFSTPGNGASNANLVTPVLDQAELAYLGTFRHTTAIPEWVLAAQVARNMRPEYDSHLYAGYSKISFRDADRANSLVGGLKLNLNEKSTLDLAYNAYKAEGTGWKSYYKLLLQLFF
jgi:hypothetical protein